MKLAVPDLISNSYFPAAAAVERPVGLWVEPVALEDDEPCVHAAPSERLHVRPRDPGGIDRTVDYAERATRAQASHSTWSK